MPPAGILEYYGLQPGDSARSRDTECSICKDNVKETVVTSCQHVYCFECITRWLSQSSKCPDCRGNLLPSTTTTPTARSGQDTAPQVLPSHLGTLDSRPSPSRSPAATPALVQQQTRINAPTILSAMWQAGSQLDAESPLPPRLRQCAKRIWTEWEDYLHAQDGRVLPEGDMIIALSRIFESTVVTYGWCDNWRDLPDTFVQTMRQIAEAGAQVCDVARSGSELASGRL